MPRFYFHLHDDIHSFDEEGIDFPTAEAALGRARDEARYLAAEEVRNGTLNLDHRIVVVSERGEVIGTVLFRDVVCVAG